MSTAMNTELTVTVWPGLTARLLRTDEGRETLAQYRDSGGYRPLSDAQGLLGDIGAAGVLGRGGAAFPMAVKLSTVRRASARGQDTVLVANGEEGEPASVKDRWLLRNRPHLVLDGLRLAAQIITGVGFLGAGAILRTRGTITGLTSAATMWAVTAIGMSIGVGAHGDAVGATSLVLLVLVGSDWLRKRLLRGGRVGRSQKRRESPGVQGDGSPGGPRETNGSRCLQGSS